MSGTTADGISCLSSPLSQVQVSWRGDGKYFATLGWSGNSEGLQRLRIWERDSGTLHSSFEPKSLTEAAMDWIPSGAKMATACNRRKSKNCASVVFFERNSMERGSFDIYEPPQAKIEMLKWNCNTEMLVASSTALSDESTAFVVDSVNVLVTPLSLSLVLPPMSLFNLKFQYVVQSVAFTSRGVDIYLDMGLSYVNLSIVKFPNMDMWDQLEGSVYETANVDTNNFIQI